MKMRNILDDLAESEFKNFKWFLKNGPKNNVKVSQVEHADRGDTVDLMVQRYKLAEAVRVMEEGLKYIKRNDLVQEWWTNSSGAEGQLQEEKPMN